MKIKAEKNRKGGQCTLCSSHCGPVRKEKSTKNKVQKMEIFTYKIGP
jgi:hypothetical protein